MCRKDVYILVHAGLRLNNLLEEVTVQFHFLQFFWYSNFMECALRSFWDVYQMFAGRLSHTLMYFFQLAWPANNLPPSMLGDIYQAFSRKLSHTLMYFFQLAWSSRIHLPSLLVVTNLLFNIRLRVEIRINM